MAQHRRLAGPRPALDADDPVAREQDRPHRFPLTGRETRAVEMRLHLAPAREPPGLADTRLHRRDHLALRLQRPVGHERPVRARELRLHQVAVPHHPRHRFPHRPDRVNPRRMGERHRLQLVRREHRLALLQLLHRAGDDLDRRRRRRRLRRLARPDRRRGPETLRAQALEPLLAQLRLHRLRLALARRERRLLHRRGGPVQAPIVHPGHDLAAPGRERLPQLPPVARDLETRYPPRHRRHDRIALVDQTPRQLVPVIGPDQPRIAVEKRRLNALPPPLRVARHVRNHRMGVQLRIPVAAGDVAEQRRHHRRRLHPRPPPRRRVPPPRLQKSPLDPSQRRPHRLVMRADHRTVAARALLRWQKRRQRHRLGGGKRDVEARTVLVLPVAQAAQRDVGSDHPALEHLLERPRRDLAALLQAQSLGPLAVPRARAAVLRLLRTRIRRVLARTGVITSVPPEILRHRRRGRQVANRRDHRLPIIAASRSTPAPPRANPSRRASPNARRTHWRACSPG